MSKGNKKQRREKRREMRRKESISPLKRLAEAKGEVECWMSPDFETGQMQLFAYKQAAGMSGIACFLVDQGVVGLKDSWAKMNISRGDFDDMIEGTGRRGLQVVRASVEDVRRVVAGGMRWAHEHGMRLPADWPKHVAIIGGVGDWKSADVSDFAKEFVGHPIDLRQRLIGESMETFLERKDIEIIFSDAAPYTDEMTGEYMPGTEFEPHAEEYEDEEDEGEEEDFESIGMDFPEDEIDDLKAQLTPTLTALVKETGTWLKTQGKTPLPGLEDAWKAIVLSSVVSAAVLPEGSEEEVAELGGELFEKLSRRLVECGNTDHIDAAQQAIEHLKTDTQLIERTMQETGFWNEESGE